MHLETDTEFTALMGEPLRVMKTWAGPHKHHRHQHIPSILTKKVGIFQDVQLLV